MTIKVLVVDDSALIRSILSEIVNTESDLELVGAAPNAFIARDMVNLTAPDVITLDIEMPKMDGLTFLDKLMRARPTPVVMISTLTEKGADSTFKALELGAVDFIAKPKIGVAEGMQEYKELILQKIRLAANAKVGRRKIVSNKVFKPLALKTTEKIVAVGASTGGTEAIKAFLTPLPADCPGIVITQHMPPGFTTTFAKRLDSLCKITVIEAQGGERILPGFAYLAPGNMHLRVVRSGANYVIELSDSERVSGHKPSVDVMFNSVSECATNNVVAVLMTGMGKDGARGLYNIKKNGGYTLVEDESTCVVFGMPKEAIRIGAETKIIPLDKLSDELISHLKSVNASSRL